MIGKTIGKYRFVAELGRGRMGAVYKAIDETLDREVAIKAVDPALTDSEVMKHFQVEATTLARLQHPDIAGIHEIQRTDTDLLMVMELVDGETLDQLSARLGPLPAERAAFLVAEVLGALEHAHTVGVVHRDLRPSKVKVTEQGRVKVMDFGMARVAGDDQATSDGFTLGSPAYMAPERLTGREADGRADIYSAGVIFYKLVTGHVPFDAPTPLEAVQKQLSGTPTPVNAYRPELPGWCQAIVDRATARLPDDRFPTAEAFRTTLLAAISEATESTGVFSVVTGSGVANPDALTTAIPIPAEFGKAVPQAAPQTVSTRLPVRSDTPTPAPSLSPAQMPTVAAPAPTPVGGTTVVLRKNQFALVGGLLLLLVIGVVVLTIAALRRPATIIVRQVENPAASTATSAPATSSSAAASTPTTEPAASTPAAAAPAGVTAPPLEVAAPPLVLPVPAMPPRPEARPATAPEVPATSPRPGLITTPFRFEARAVVADGDKRRERDAIVLVADGNLTVTERDKNAKPLYIVPLDSLVGLTYSSSRQPLWDSPEGPAEAMRVEGGAFGFLKGGRNNWFGFRTSESLLVLRVDDDMVARVTTGLEERTGLSLKRLVEPKD